LVIPGPPEHPIIDVAWPPCLSFPLYKQEVFDHLRARAG